MQDINAISAARFYAAARPATRADQTAAEQGAASAAATVATDFARTLQQGEDAARAALTGKADMTSLVEAMARAELAVETAVTVRDKVVEAYQEILRMPV